MARRAVKPIELGAGTGAGLSYLERSASQDEPAVGIVASEQRALEVAAPAEVASEIVAEVEDDRDWYASSSTTSSYRMTRGLIRTMKALAYEHNATSGEIQAAALALFANFESDRRHAVVVEHQERMAQARRAKRLRERHVEQPPATAVAGEQTAD